MVVTTKGEMSMGVKGGSLLYDPKNGIIYFSIKSRKELEEVIDCLSYSLRQNHYVHDDPETHHPVEKGEIPGECAICGWQNSVSAPVTRNITMYTVISLAVVYLGRRYNEGARAVIAEMRLDIHGLLSHFSVN